MSDYRLPTATATFSSSTHPLPPFVAYRMEGEYTTLLTYVIDYLVETDKTFQRNRDEIETFAHMIAFSTCNDTDVSCDRLLDVIEYWLVKMTGATPVRSN